MEEIDFTQLEQLDPHLWGDSAVISGAQIYAAGCIGTMPDRENAKSLIRKFGNRFKLRTRTQYFGLTFSDYLYFCRADAVSGSLCLWRVSWDRIECMGPKQIRIFRPED